MTGPLVTDRHLGGYYAGGDPDTIYPVLWEWLVRSLVVRSVLDVGCGDGAALDAFAELGADVCGIDGIPQTHPRIVEHDFTTGPYPHSMDADLVWSCEFVEHVEEEFIPNYLPALTAAPLVLMTHAFPGQPGWNHVNCRVEDYWVGVMAAVGYRLDEDLTAKARDLAGLNVNPSNHFVRSGLAFVS